MSKSIEATALKRTNTKLLVQLALLVALEIILVFTPLASIPLGTAIVATTAHIPVIIAAIMLGRKSGIFMGGVFGVLSLIVWTVYTPPSSAAFAFTFTPAYNVPGTDSGSPLSLLVVLVPRIILGLAAAELYRVFMKFDKNGHIACPLASVLATLTHTVLVLGMIYVFFGRAYAEVNQIEYSALLGAMGVIVVTNGLLEALIAALITSALVRVVPVLKRDA